MSEDEKMLIDERYKYLRMMQRRYKKANRRERQALLDEMEAMTGCHRKSLIRHMKGVPKREKRGRQRGRVYGAEVEDALRVIAPSFDYLCAERLRPNLEWMANQLEKHGELEVSESLRAQLREISTATVSRILVRIGQDDRRLPRKGPARANQVRREVPMERIGWDETEPGHFEVDTVHHSGSSASGEYVHTLQMIDVALLAVIGQVVGQDVTPKPPALSDDERALVEHAVQELDGAFTVGKLTTAFQGRISQHVIRDIASRWEREGLLTPPAGITAPRRITPALAALAGCERWLFDPKDDTLSTHGSV